MKLKSSQLPNHYIVHIAVNVWSVGNYSLQGTVGANLKYCF